jgi:hypothetical protein
VMIFSERMCFQGFFARPETLDNGSVNLMKWNCGIPGKEGVGPFLSWKTDTLIGIAFLRPYGKEVHSP